MPERLDGRLAEFKRQLDRLPGAEAPPPTTLQVLGRGQLEQDWQRLLFHFLSPERPHGLDHAFLEHLLTPLADHDEVEYTCSPFDLTDTLVDTEVQTSNERRPLRMGCDLRRDMGGQWFASNRSVHS